MTRHPIFCRHRKSSRKRNDSVPSCHLAIEVTFGGYRVQHVMHGVGTVAVDIGDNLQSLLGHTVIIFQRVPTFPPIDIVESPLN